MKSKSQFYLFSKLKMWGALGMFLEALMRYFSEFTYAFKI